MIICKNNNNKPFNMASAWHVVGLFKCLFPSIFFPSPISKIDLNLLAGNQRSVNQCELVGNLIREHTLAAHDYC